MRDTLFAFGLIGAAALPLVEGWWLARWMRNKGYTNPLFAVIPPVAATCASVGGFAIGCVASTSALAIVTFCVVPYALITALTVFYYHGLSPTDGRRGGRRVLRFPYRLASAMLFLLAIVLLAIQLVSKYMAGPGVRLLAIAGIYCLYMSRRGRASSAEDVLSLDGRAPVLFLRSFDVDAEVFVELGPSELSKYMKDGIPSFANPPIGPSVEQFLSAEITASIGPFIALGNPTDLVPPSGAAREYAQDAQWKSTFVDLARQSACIVTTLAYSAGLRWELKRVRKMKLHQRLFIVVPPKRERTFGIRALHWLRASSHLRHLRNLPARWACYSRELAEIGYEVASDWPGYGAVITFAADAKSKTLCFGAFEPEEYVLAILGGLNELNAPAESVVKELSDEGPA